MTTVNIYVNFIYMKRKVDFYRTAQKKCPVQDFLDSLKGKVAQKVTWTIMLLENFDKIPQQYFKKLSGSDGIWECRIRINTNIYRIFCFFAGNSVIVLTHGIVKKTQKIPIKEIKKEEKYKNDYLQMKRGKK